MTRYEAIKEAIENMNSDDIIALHNDYCENSGYMDDFVYSMEEIDEMLNGKTPDEILNMSFYGDFKPCDDYFTFDGYGNLVSFDCASDSKSPIYIDDIARYVDDNDDSLGASDIDDILLEYEED